MNPADSPSPGPSPFSSPAADAPDFSGRLLIGLEGPELAGPDRRRLAHPAVGGAILFARNFRSAAQLRRLAAAIRRAAPAPILIAADHEGGRVQRFGPPDFTTIPPMREIPSDAAARDCGVVAAAELAAAGLDLSFAPVADLDRGKSAVIGDRAFSANPQVVAARALAFAAGMRAAGMRACAKHFPGHGAVAADSHAETPSDPRPLEAIRAADLVPFRAWAAAGMPAVMTAHIAYPRADSAAATFSSFWLKKILRDEIGFGGIVVGDDLAMRGAAVGGPAERMRKALAAGCDALMICEPEMIDPALAGAECDPAKGAWPWRKLSARPDGRVTVGDLEYENARGRIKARWDGAVF